MASVPESEIESIKMLIFQKFGVWFCQMLLFHLEFNTYIYIYMYMYIIIYYSYDNGLF